MPMYARKTTDEYRIEVYQIGKGWVFVASHTGDGALGRCLLDLKDRRANDPDQRRYRYHRHMIPNGGA